MVKDVEEAIQQHNNCVVNHVELEINDWPLISSGMKGMMGGSSLATVSRYARWFLDGSCGNNHTVLRCAVALLYKIHHSDGWGWCCQTHTGPADSARCCSKDGEVVSTYHEVFKFPVKLLEFAGKFLWKQIKVEGLICDFLHINISKIKYVLKKINFLKREWSQAPSVFVDLSPLFTLTACSCFMRFM